MKIKISNFKKIENVETELEQINIFIGTNNAGKSSFIQGIQFSISACQTLMLLNGKWVKGKTKTLSLDSREFLYTPTSDISYLFHGKKLSGSRKKEDRSWIEFSFEDNNKTSKIQISRGKNGGFTTQLHGKELGEELSSIENPYCVYVPGIAGVPILEKYEVPISVKKSATRGDSNNYLRNIIYAISKNTDKWAAFTNSINAIYPDIQIDVSFDENTSEYITVYISTEKYKLPLDSVGTGLLQVIQIFAYIEYFSPKLILLDEPDSHLHPTKQKNLASELTKRTDSNKDLKIVFSTHSRYILETLEHKAKVFHFQNGSALSDVQYSNILVDIGAADADYLFAKKNLKYIIATEDKVDDVKQKKEFLKKILISNGIKEEEFVLHSYESCTKVDFAKILKSFVQKQIPNVQVILHVDRDQRIKEDRELLKLEDDCNERGIKLFITKYQEIESYFCTPKNIRKAFDISITEATRIFEENIEQLKEKSIIKIRNFILWDRPELIRNSGGKPDTDRLFNLANEMYEQNKIELTPGKELMGLIKNHVQKNLGLNPEKLIECSDGLIDEEFQALFD